MVTEPIEKTARAPLRLAILTFLAIAAGASDGIAQTIDCSAYRAELASISRNADPRGQEYAVAAQRQRAELERTRAYYNQIGCTRGDNFRPVGECAPLRAHMQQMQANMNEMLAYADRLGGGPRSQERRRQLQAALDRHCANEPAQPRGFFERLFGGSQATNEPPPPQTRETPVPEVAVADEERSLGGSQPVCVRLADGYFFPLGGRFEGASHAQQLCQAQCPATRTELFFMSQGGVIDRAQSASGTPYSALPNANVFQKRLVAEASCLPAGQSWQQALQGAQTLTGTQGDDIIVTAEKAQELSRPRVSSRTASRSAPRAPRAPEPADVEEVTDASELPTGGGDSAGIGPGFAGEETTLSRREGTMITAAAPDGSRRNVRIVAPYLIPTPEGLRRN